VSPEPVRLTWVTMPTPSTAHSTATSAVNRNRADLDWLAAPGACGVIPGSGGVSRRRGEGPGSWLSGCIAQAPNR